MLRLPARRLACLLLATTPACGDDSTATAQPETGSATGTTAAPDDTGPPTTGPDGTTGTAGSSTDPMFDPPAAECGNGYLEGDEECDDGNRDGGDGCSPACEVPCGLSQQIVELAPSADSELYAQSISVDAEGGFLIAALQQTITNDQEGNQTKGPLQTRLVRYDVFGDKLWEVFVGPDDVDITPSATAIDAAGDIYINATVAGQDKDDIFVTKLSGADGAAIWAHVHDGALIESDDLGSGIAIADDGDVIAVGTVRDVEMSDDVWVRKLDAATGKELWTTTWTGAGDGGFSLDRGGRVAVGPDGALYVGAHEFVTYESRDAVLLKFAADGGPAEWVFSPLGDGSEHTNNPDSVAVDADGNVLFAAIRGKGVVPAFWLYKVDPDMNVVWEHDRDDYIVPDHGEDWSLGGLQADSAGGAAVLGYFRQKDTMASLAWFTIWAARLSPAGEKLCQVEYTAPGSDLVPPSVYGYDLAVTADDRAIAAGELVIEGEPQLWTGMFRAP